MSRTIAVVCLVVSGTLVLHANSLNGKGPEAGLEGIIDVGLGIIFAMIGIGYGIYSFRRQ